MIRATARQQGGAVILTIPADILKLRQIKAGDHLGIDLTPDGFIVRKTGVPEAYSATPGPVVCEPLGLRFPILYRGKVTTTVEEVRTVGMEEDPEVTVGTRAHYSLDRSETMSGILSWEQVSHILRGDRSDSLAIRHHRSIENAIGYIDASTDLTLGRTEEEKGHGRMLFETEEGIFTFTPVRTNPSWPGPLVLYLANVPSNRVGMECWAHVVGPDGEVVELPEFKILPV